jgi:hypothetical protein
MVYKTLIVVIACLLTLSFMTTAAQPPSRIQPEDLTYIGAFRLPPEIGWEYGGAAMAYFPDGDPAGPDDGFPGSLFATGHNWYQEVAEISIPAPVFSRNATDLPVAEMLQPFQNIRGDLFDFLDFEIPRVGLAYLPAQAAQSTGKLYVAWGEHYQEEGQAVSHGWSELDLADPETAGAWFLGDYRNYSTNDYIFSIPAEWADTNTPGMLLATGRYRDGGWSGQGPSLFAYGPWNQGNPPEPNTRLDAVPLLLYGSTLDASDVTMDNYQHSDEWAGGAWLTAGDRSAVVFVGTKGVGECWYGFANGVVWPDEPPYPDVPPPPYEDRGWWSTTFEGQFLFYDPAEFAEVARGNMAPHEPQPYATLNVDNYLLNIQSEQQLYHLGAAAFDRDNGLLYVFEQFGDGDRPVVHVWYVE